MADLFVKDEENGDLLPEEEEEEEDILDMEGMLMACGVQQQDDLLMRFCPHDRQLHVVSSGTCTFTYNKSVLPYVPVY